MNHVVPTGASQPRKKMGLLKKLALGVLALIIIGALLPNKKGSASASSAETANDTLIRCYVVSKRVLKEGLKDPESFQEIDATKYFVNPVKGKTGDTHVQVLIKYRAKNSFGGYVVSKQAFNFNKNLQLTDSYKMD